MSEGAVADATGHAGQIEKQDVMCPACENDTFHRTIVDELGGTGELGILICKNCGVMLAEGVIAGDEGSLDPDDPYADWPDHPGRDCKCQECAEMLMEQADNARDRILEGG